MFCGWCKLSVDTVDTVDTDDTVYTVYTVYTFYSNNTLNTVYTVECYWTLWNTNEHCWTLLNNISFRGLRGFGGYRDFSGSKGF